MEKVKPIETPPTTHIPVEPILTPPMVKKFPQSNKSKMIPAILFLVVILLGSATGWVLAKRQTGGNNVPTSISTKNSVATDTEAGINDTSAFPDTAQGILKEGPWMGEGTHHLDRSATKEKEVSLSSTIIDLSKFVGKKVEVRGQTISGKSGWLMDVGKIKAI